MIVTKTTQVLPEGKTQWPFLPFQLKAIETINYDIASICLIVITVLYYAMLYFYAHDIYR